MCDGLSSVSSSDQVFDTITYNQIIELHSLYSMKFYCTWPRAWGRGGGGLLLPIPLHLLLF